jgi:signal transduction histidine kinase/HPt (histidine-containing phosphotransfer) domain-containing protein
MRLTRWHDLLHAPAATALTETLAAAGRTLGMEGAALLFLDGQTARLEAVVGTPAARAAFARLARGDLARAVFQADRPLLPADLPAALRLLCPPAWIGLPLVLPDLTCGLMLAAAAPQPPADPAILRWISRTLQARLEVIDAAGEQQALAAQVAELRLDLERAERLKNDFLSTMTHEIHTPMNAILGMNDLLLGTALSPEQREFAQVSRDSGQRLLGLLNDILDYTRLEARQITLADLAYSPGEVAVGAVAQVRERAEAKRLRLVYRPAPDLPVTVRGDPARFRQVLLQLLSNALKFTERGGVQVSLTHSLSPRPLLRCEVRDSGIGLSAADQERLFQPFSQVDGSRTRRFGGVGLGLVIAKSFVDLMGGELGVVSQPGEGARFWFTLAYQPVSGPPVNGPTVSAPSELEADAAPAPVGVFPAPPSVSAIPGVTLDATVLARLRELQPPGETNFLRELVEIYLREAQRVLDNMETALERQQAENLHFFAQRLKGNSANLGARRMTAICHELEKAGRNGRLQGADVWLAAARQEFAAVEAQMRAEFPTLE